MDRAEGNQVQPTEHAVRGIAVPVSSSVYLAVCAWFVAAVVLWIAILQGPEKSLMVYAAKLGIGLGALAGIMLGCWKIRAGTNCLRVLYTTLSVCCLVLVPFAALGGDWDLGRQALAVLTLVLVVMALIAAWVPDSNWYFFEMDRSRHLDNEPKHAPPP